MSPELERLVQALYEKRTCPPEEKAHRNATFERLLQDSLARRPGTSREELLSALHDRYEKVPPRPAPAAYASAARVSAAHTN